MGQRFARTSEHVSEGHPDKFCDQVADRILDEVLAAAAEQDEKEPPRTPDEAVLRYVRTAIECLVKDNLLVVSGEVKLTPTIRAELDIIKLAREVWKEVGYGDVWSGGYGKDDEEQVNGELTVINHIRTQSKNIGTGDQKRTDETEEGTGIDKGGAGDQGIMVGYATDETPELMPREWVFARDLCMKLRELRLNGTLGWLRSDCKTQVSVDADGSINSVIIAAQHSPNVTAKTMEEHLRQHVIGPVVGKNVPRVRINGTGVFVVGGPTGDAGVVGRKIVIDAYGPRVPVGGGAYSGKDPTKVDRSAAYMCRHIAKAVVQNKIEGAHDCTVTLAYGIGQHEPEMFTVITDAGVDIAQKVRDALKLNKVGKDSPLSPKAIIERLGLRQPKGWSYYQTASYGHYGRDIFPWEQPFKV
jgi:S-adenosylmethionine synthetase